MSKPPKSPAPRKPAETHKTIHVRGAREHNLKNVDLEIPRDALVKAVRGLSGFAGLTGAISCSAVGECNTAGPTFFVVKDGAWVEAP